MKKRDRDLLKISDAIRATRFLGLTTVTIDIDTLERAFDARYNDGLESGKEASEDNQT